MRRLIQSVLLLMMISLAACQEVAIVHDLNERDANEILVLLAKNEIKASKEQEIKNQEVFWKINVAGDLQIQAQSILVANHLPRVQQGGLKGYCKEADMIVTEKFEKCQAILAQKEEIINALESIPGVVSADVVLNIPDKAEFLDDNSPSARPSAAVTVKYLVDANVKTTLNESKIQEFVANSVQEMDPRDVQVIMSYLVQTISDQKKSDEVKKADATSQDLKANNDKQAVKKADTVKQVVTSSDSDDLVSVFGLKMKPTAAKKFKIIAALVLVLLLVLTGAFIFALIRLASLRKKGATMTAPVPVNSDDNLLEA